MRSSGTTRRFSLVPFRTGGTGPAIKIAGSVGRRPNLLSVGYSVLGELEKLEIPAPDGSPGRKDRLWEETCLEFFLGTRDSEGYWEFNLSPAGHWNVYRFTSCREGMREEEAFPSLPFLVRREPDALRLYLDLDPGKIIPAGKTLEVAVCAVLRTVTGTTSHWALVHTGPQPDFHRRDGFTLTIPGE
ncbi:MAG: DOMON-like domain-containing protein [Deltaproteobacteria bacterium]|nr:DOMON-like domain-containing protein [Deltaproteobacteria bacterium]